MPSKINFDPHLEAFKLCALAEIGEFRTFQQKTKTQWGNVVRCTFYILQFCFQVIKRSDLATCFRIVDEPNQSVIGTQFQRNQ